MTATEAWRRVGGAAALAGGVMWTAKSLSILVTGHQPPLLLEGGMPLFGLALVGLVADGPGSATRRVAGGLGVLAAVTGSLALGADLAGEV